MTKGSCDPSPELHNKTVLSKDNGRVTFTVRWSWDGVSVYPDCQGPIFDVRVQNTGPDVWTLSLPEGDTQKTRDLLPGVDQTFTGQQLAGIGLLTVDDVANVTLTPKA
jgi:hypothetical protein